MLVLNFVFALIWMALKEEFSFIDFIVGFGLGFAIIALSQKVLQDQIIRTTKLRSDGSYISYPERTMKTFSLMVFMFWSIIKANIDVARIIIRPRLDIQPGILAIPLDVQSEIGITLLSNLITLTPGTVTLDISHDRKTLYVHVMDIKDPDAARKEIKEDFERRVMDIFP